jgi:hypothetical protein
VTEWLCANAVAEHSVSAKEKRNKTRAGLRMNGLHDSSSESLGPIHYRQVCFAGKVALREKLGGWNSGESAGTIPANWMGAVWEQDAPGEEEKSFKVGW